MSWLAFWPAWLYLAQRAVDGSDEPLGVLALAALLVCGARPPSRLGLMAYALAWLCLPPLLQAAVALLVIFARTPATIGLALLALPSLASLQFYLGYPLRVVVAEGALRMLAPLGFAGLREGVGLRWGTHLVSVDPPCSGLRMLWMALFLTMLLSWRRSWDARTTVRRAVEAVVLTVLDNVLRVTALFLVEVRGFPEQLHEPVGAVCFGFLALALSRPGGVARTTEPRPVPKAAGRILCLLVAALGLVPRPAAGVAYLFGPWPRALDGHELRWVGPADVPVGFPGRAGLFRCASAVVLVRQVTRPTRQLHASADCLRGQGLVVGESCDGRYRAGPWRVEERLVDAEGRRYDDVSAWYWAAVTGRSRGPWTAYTIFAAIPQGSDGGPARAGRGRVPLRRPFPGD